MCLLSCCYEFLMQLDLTCQVLRLDIRVKIFTKRVVRCWNRLLREAAHALSLVVFKARLGGALGNLIYYLI